jgi:hypothetical protein
MSVIRFNNRKLFLVQICIGLISFSLCRITLDYSARHFGQALHVAYPFR